MENVDDLLAIDVCVLRLLSHVRRNPRGATVGSFVDSEYARYTHKGLQTWIPKQVVTAMNWAFRQHYLKSRKIRSIMLSDLRFFATVRLEITRDGEVIADRFIQAEENLALRVELVRERLFAWLARDRHSYEGRGSGHCGSRLISFGTDFFGHHVSHGEVRDAALYLIDRGLIAGKFAQSNVDELTLTTEGLDCIKRGLRITDYLKDRKRRRNEQGGSSIVMNYHISDSQQFVAGSQKEVIQHNNSGLELQQLIQIAQLVRQVAPTLNLDALIEAKLVQEAGLLEKEATDGPQDRGRLRRAGESMMAILQQAAPTAARDFLVATAKQALSTIRWMTQTVSHR